MSAREHSGEAPFSHGEADALGLLYFPFLGGLAHELGNPLSGIAGYLGFLNSGGVDLDSAEAFRDLEASARRAQELVALLARCSRPEPVASAFDPVQLFRDVANLVQPLARRQGLQVEIREVEGIPGLVGFPWRLRAALLGLVGLALAPPTPQQSRLLLTLRPGGPGCQVEIGLPSRGFVWLRQALESPPGAGAARRALESLGQVVAVEERPPGAAIVVSLG